MNIRSESRYVWPDVEADDACNSPWSYGQHEVEVGYLASQLLLPRELPRHAPERSRFWQGMVRRLRDWPLREWRGLRVAEGAASVARVRAQAALG